MMGFDGFGILSVGIIASPNPLQWVCVYMCVCGSERVNNTMHDGCLEFSVLSLPHRLGLVWGVFCDQQVVEEKKKVKYQ